MLLLLLSSAVSAQDIHRFRTNQLELLYFGKRYSFLMPQVVSTYTNAQNFHRTYWDLDTTTNYVVLTDFEDDGHGGAMVMPHNQVILGIAPFNYAFSIIPSSERFQWLFNHELTHISLADKANARDKMWRKFLMGKVRRDEKHPLSAMWSFLTAPRWYAPRWYAEGIACYMETWMSGGLGRALGAYDEMYFRSIIRDEEPIYSVIGLETEGSTIDFQVGANAYLYGTRFITYLSQAYGDEKLKAFYARTDDSKAFYSSQFKKVYNKSVGEAWGDWIRFEKEFQLSNLNTIKQFPLTSFSPLHPEPLGSFSTVGYDEERGKLYAAINHPGDISHIAEIDIKSGKMKKLAVLDAPMLYSVTFLAYNAAEQKIYITEQNNKYRSLVEVDAQSGKKRTLIPTSRISNLVFNPLDKCIWGVQHDNGYASLVKIPPPYNKSITMYSAEFGRSLFDLSVSNDGKKISASLSGIRGEQSLILFNTDELERGMKEYETIYSLEDNTLTQFRFSSDDRYLIGTSYFTGVSNIWRISLEDKQFELLSNDETGLFNPVQVSDDSLFVLKFMRNGMQPGLIPIEVREDASAIEFLGNRVIENSPEVVNYSLPPASVINIDSVKIDEMAYSPLRNMTLTDAYPDITGFKETVSLGYRLNWRDRIGISNVNVFLGASPWSDYSDKQKLQGMIHWSYWLWSFTASYNKTDFYDLFGPIKRSRAGYSLSLGYHKNMTRRSPFEWHYGFDISHYGDLEVLPEFQNIGTPLKSFQGLSINIGLSKLRTSLGGVDDEKGYLWELTANNYVADGSTYPSLISEQSIGWLLPVMRNTSFWIRNSIGQAFGVKTSPFSQFYFGGFRNNYVDWQDPQQYRKVFAFPGQEIDALNAHNFIKTIAELNLQPVRLRNIGATWLYPTYIQPSVFGMHLLRNPDDNSRDHNFNAGVQLDLELVLFSYLKTTWSAAYARLLKNDAAPAEQWMFSVKLLGN